VPDQETTSPPAVAPPENTATAEPKRFADLDLLQEEVARRLADNQKFLSNFLDEDYEEEEDGAVDGDGDDEDFEEL